jgi:citrate synthase
MDKIIKELAGIAKKNIIDPELYNHYKVYRGLRHPFTNAGILVGLTEISSVTGSIIKDEERIAVEGELRYRNIDINRLVKEHAKGRKFGFEKVAFLLIFGRLPKEKESKAFMDHLGKIRKVPEEFITNMIIKHPSSNIMNKLARSVLALYSYDKNPDDNSIENNVRQSLILLAQFPTLIAYEYIALAHHFKKQSLYIHHIDPKLSTAEHFLHTIRPDSEYTPTEVDVLDICLILHAEHGGGNNSTFTTHVTTSSGTDIYSSIAAAIGSLKGPLHGGANQSVIKMIKDIKNNIPRSNWYNKRSVMDYLEKILRKEVGDKSGLIYGMGHAVYTVSDPRTVILEEYAEKLAKEKGKEDEFRLYMTIKEAAPLAFKKNGKNRIISANVDFYSGFVYQLLELPEEVYTPLFAMARIAGWCAHRIEELINGKKIIRPAYKYVAPNSTLKD